MRHVLSHGKSGGMVVTFEEVAIPKAWRYNGLLLENYHM
jgi:hypothetical protein